MATTLPLAEGHFLPRLVSVFFAIFHPTDGPKVLYQVPEGSITEEEENGDSVAAGDDELGPLNHTLPPSRVLSFPNESQLQDASTAALDSIITRSARSTSRDVRSRSSSRPPFKADQQPKPQEKSKPLFNFSALSDYLIPKAPLCGRLVTCTTCGLPRDDAERDWSPEGQLPKAPSQGYKILGHPMVIKSSKYARNMLVYNLCFVFDSNADVRAYEPIVRKCARVLRDLELNSSFLSDPKSLQRMYGITEQLFQDLNSYCESFVTLPVLPHTLYGKRDPSGVRAAPDMGRTGSVPQQASLHGSRGGSMDEGGTSGTFSPVDQRGLSASIASLIRSGSNSAALKTNSTSRKGSSDFGSDQQDPLSSRSSERNAMSGANSDTSRSRAGSLASITGYGSSSNAGSAVIPFSIPAMALTPILEPAPRSNQRESYLDDAAISPTAPVDGQQLGDGGLASGSKKDSRPAISRDATVKAVSDTTMAVRKSSLEHSSSSLGGAVGATKLSGDSTLAGNPKRNLSASAASLLEATEAASATSSSPISEAGNDSPSAAHMRRSGCATNASKHGSIDTMGGESGENDALYDSIMTLRNMATANAAGADVSAGAADGISLPGKREPPHGLGRTVRDAINLKLFPTYPNPPTAKDWDVPVGLLDLESRIDNAWDLTMAKIVPFVDGINHVKRIAQLADADIGLTRQCMEHLLYYGCIIMIDLFQFSNMYTVRPVIARIADGEGISRECAAYVTRPGFQMPHYPTLLQLYSTFRPGKTVSDWIEEQDVDSLGIDPRRLVTFGVIKGFLRRVHRWPIFLEPPFAPQDNNTSVRQDVRHAASEHGTWIPRQEDSANGALSKGVGVRHEEDSGERPTRCASMSRERGGDSKVPLSAPCGSSPVRRHHGRYRAPHGRHRRPMKRNTTATVLDVAAVALGATRGEEEDRVEDSPWLDRASSNFQRNSAWNLTESSGFSRATLRKQPSTASLGIGQSSTYRASVGGASGAGAGCASGFTRLSEEYRAQHQLPLPDELLALLDGLHHEDNICVRFGVGWADLDTWLQRLGGASRPQAMPFAAGQCAGDDRWDDETPMMSGIIRPGQGSIQYASFRRTSSREMRSRVETGSRERESKGVHGVASTWVDAQDQQDKRTSSRLRDPSDYGAIKVILK
ncbi:NPR2-domain-containing protein [Tilletiaria anomala UBC 951]|uniref:NPR2-domain-containing protein n=1 Tax=Tilletiaria anomala (strain ATCC 24038 / CBS 436.72 / UBC 951) TaxID=1037660 RepID=A0A066W8P2_TILAU|nr:NPR2-domain-containing protein [Tilletiaria anomala UBC 951]KDN48883.1 NPR2-domain-containing protein [Tilletiaria anomala UBC 951]